MTAKEKPDLERAFKITLPCLWGIHRGAVFNDGRGILSIETLRQWKPYWTKLQPDGTQTVTTDFSFAEEAECYRQLGAEVEEITLEEAHELMFQYTVSEEYKLRAAGNHHKADRLFGKKLVLDPAGRVEHQPASELETQEGAHAAAVRTEWEKRYGPDRKENFALAGDPTKGETKPLPPEPEPATPPAGRPPHEMLEEPDDTKSRREMEASLSRASRAKQAVDEAALKGEKPDKK